MVNVRTSLLIFIVLVSHHGWCSAHFVKRDSMDAVANQALIEGCKCYNPFDDSQQAFLGDKEWTCEKNQLCYVHCDSQCGDVEHASGFTAKSGRCVSRLACHFQLDTKPGIVTGGDDNAPKQQVVDTEPLELPGVENVKSVEDPEADTAISAEDLAEVPDVTIKQPVKELDADKMQNLLHLDNSKVVLLPSFTPVPSCSVTFYPLELSFVVTAVMDGHIFVCGGQNSDLTEFYSSCYFLISTGKWLAGPDMLQKRSKAASSMTSQGLLVTGGSDSVDTHSSTGYLTYSAGKLTAGKWSPGPDLPWPVRDHCQVTAGGAVYVIGGVSDGGALDSVVKLENNVWSAVGGLGEARHGHSCVLHGGYIYAIGGEKAAGASVERMDIATDTWESAPSLPSEISYGQALSYGSTLYMVNPEGQVWKLSTAGQWEEVVGAGDIGYIGTRRVYPAPVVSPTEISCTNYTINEVEVPDFDDAKLSEMSDVTISQPIEKLDDIDDAHNLLHLDNSKVVLLPSFTPVPSCSVTFYPLELSFVVTAVLDGHIFVCGGQNSDLTEFYSSCYFLISTGKWLAGPDMLQKRYKAASSMTSQGLLVTGGSDGVDTHSSTGYLTYSAGKLTAGKWSPGPDLPGPVRDHCQVTAGGAVYVIGGDSDGGALDSVVKLENGVWSTVGGLGEARLGHSCVLHEGYIYAIGGEKATGTSVERMDIATDTWESAPSLPSDISYGQALSYGSTLYVVNPEGQVWKLSTAGQWEEVVGAGDIGYIGTRRVYPAPVVSSTEISCTNYTIQTE